MRDPREVLTAIRGTFSPARRRPVNVLIENELAEATCSMAEIVESVLDRLDKLEAEPPARPASKKSRDPEQQVTR